MQKLKLYAKQTVIGLMAILFFSNVTFAHSLDFHICQGELQSVAFFGQKASCSKMMEAEMDTPRSCCDVKKDQSGLVFKQKSCCENVQLVQDNLLDKPSIDLDNTSINSIDFIHNFEETTVNLKQVNLVIEKVEIPPPPNIQSQHSQENLQVFVI